MIAGRPEWASSQLRDLRAVSRRAPLVLLDFQGRESRTGNFSDNADAGSLLHELCGHDTVIAESTAMYVSGRPSARPNSKPAPEVAL
ncbi:hypothetical protein ABZZ80_38155 [Streptomyces sp. NPDC006356]